MGKRHSISLTNRRKKKDLRKRREVVWDFETCGLAVARLLSPGTDFFLDKPEIRGLLDITPPPSMLYNTDYSTHLYRINHIAALSTLHHIPFITAVQQKSQLPEIDTKSFDISSLIEKAANSGGYFSGIRKHI